MTPDAPKARGRRRLAIVLVAGASIGGLVLQLDGRDDGPDGASGTGSAAPRTTPSAPATSAAPSTTTTTTLDPARIVPTDRFTGAPGRSAVVGTGPRRTYAVEVEVGIPIDPAMFAAAVDATLADPRGWTAGGNVSLQRVAPDEPASFRVRLATPATVDSRCAPLRTNGIYSCRQGADVMINLTRWLRGASESHLSLEGYRHYVISHEVGHALGHGHVGCPAEGALAPVMMQQTKGLDGCAPNPWPHP